MHPGATDHYLVFSSYGTFDHYLVFSTYGTFDNPLPRHRLARPFALLSLSLGSHAVGR